MDEGLFAQVNAIYSQAYNEVIPLVIKAVWSGQETEEAVAAIFRRCSTTLEMKIFCWRIAFSEGHITRSIRTWSRSMLRFIRDYMKRNSHA